LTLGGKIFKLHPIIIIVQSERFADLPSSCLTHQNHRKKTIYKQKHHPFG
jgi:hypothetical protein